VKKLIKKALNHEGPVITEVEVDPFEPPIPPQVNLDYVKNIAKSFTKGQPYPKKIASTIITNQIKEKINKFNVK
jgi:pyruvate dehydrogenase (quinone)/pyruvate oxidase